MLCEGALQRWPEDFAATELLGVIALRRDDARQAAELFARAISIDARRATAHNYLASALLAQGQCGSALACCDRSLAIAPDFAEAHYNRGNALFDLGRYDTARASYDRAIAIDATYVPALKNRGLCSWRLGMHADAIADHDRALALEPGNADAYCYRGHALRDDRQWLTAIASYDAAISLKRDHAEAHNGRGSTLAALRRYEEALESYDNAIAADPKCPELHLNRGNVLLELNRSEQAIRSYQQAIGLKTDFAEAHYKCADAFRAIGRFEEALECLDRAHASKPDLPYLRGLRCHLRMRVCDWRGLQEELQELTALVEAGHASCPPFAMLAMTSSAALQQKTARIHQQRECPPDSSLGAIARRARQQRIRVGYFSADFRDHPVSYLIAELIETHDRAGFEVTGFALGAPAADDMRRRLQRAFDRFLDVQGISDRDLAKLAREMKIDIAVDLGGYTAGCRPTLFAMRAAPVQISYLGYLGTLAAPYMDYVIADPVTITPASRSHYQESILYLPHYQANDSKRQIAHRVLNREELGLPAEGFVYCCLNTPYKIAPASFSGWMRILQRVPNSVLYLYAESRSVAANLRREALAHRVDPGRLVFTGALSRPEYLARMRSMDLYLDTLPYNAGTMASDALFAGLPVLSCVGEAFASRMAASVLSAAGLPELITTSAQEYESLAVQLALDPARFADIKRALKAQRTRAPLFDTPRFTRHLEAGFRMVHERECAGLPPCDIRVTPCP